MTESGRGRAPGWLQPVWPAPANVRAMQTLRKGGISDGVWSSLNLGDHVGDDEDHVAENRRRVGAMLPGAPLWLKQVHGLTVADADVATGVPEADAAVARQPGRVCAVMTADCLPLLLCDRAGSVVAAAHAGWRGLQAGVIEATVAAMRVQGAEVLAWLGPAIGPEAFEVGDEVRQAFVAEAPSADAAFRSHGTGKWLADLYSLARQRLAGCGVTAVFGGDFCTFGDAQRFYSYRRDGVTGRMATLIWRT